MISESFWIGFEKRASVFGTLKPIANKITQKATPENVLKTKKLEMKPITQKSASVWGSLKPAINKAVQKTKPENVLNYKKINAPKASPGNTLDYAAMKPNAVPEVKPPPTLDYADMKMNQPAPPAQPKWKQGIEQKRMEVAKKTPGVIYD